VSALSQPRSIARIFAGIAITSSLITPASLAAYPERPVRLLIPSTPGSGPDAVVRILATQLGQMLGQQVVADNRAGANGILASEIVARAQADGYTLLTTSSSHTINPHMYHKLPYDSLRDFTPITRFVSTGGLVVVVTPGFAAKSITQLIEIARAQPGKITYASAGVGNLTHLAAAMFAFTSGIELTHVPYKGGGPAITDLVAGHVPLMFASGPASIPFVKSGRLRALAYTGHKRSQQIPEVPTMHEAGVKGFEASSWYGLYGPAKLPSQIVTRLYQATRDAVHHPEARHAYAQFSIEPVDSKPDEFAQFLRDDLAKYARVVKSAGIEKQ
jgi:tripartite-type tricarboxylate transporter receptor subunit TctC